MVHLNDSSKSNGKHSGGDRDLKNVIKKNDASETLHYDCGGEDHLRSDILCQSPPFILKQQRESGNNSRKKSGNRDDSPQFFNTAPRKAKRNGLKFYF